MPKDPICGMDVDSKSGLQLKIGEETFYFCSEHCRKKFAAEKGLSEEEVSKCSSCEVSGIKKKWYRNKVFIITVVLSIIVVLSYFIPLIEPFRKSLFMYFRKIWWAVALGILLGGVIDRFVPREYVSKILSKPQKRTVLYAVLTGFLMSACSHGILALSIELHKKGASNPAVISFLLASPWANMAITIMLIGFFGLKAFFIIISAIVIAIITGFIFQFLDSKGLIEKNNNTSAVDSNFSIIGDIKRRINERKSGGSHLREDIKGVIEGSVSLGNMVLWWILLGMGIASLAAAYVPTEVFHRFMGPSIGGLFITLTAATVIEVCSEGSAPLAFEIFRATGALGNSFVFLMAGVVTDYTEIGLIWSNIGKKTAIWLPVVAVPQVIILGLIANWLF